MYTCMQLLAMSVDYTRNKHTSSINTHTHPHTHTNSELWLSCTRKQTNIHNVRTLTTHMHTAGSHGIFGLHFVPRLARRTHSECGSHRKVVQTLFWCAGTCNLCSGLSLCSLGMHLTFCIWPPARFRMGYVSICLLSLRHRWMSYLPYLSYLGLQDFAQSKCNSFLRVVTWSPRFRTV
jgi:hypothetical protein